MATILKIDSSKVSKTVKWGAPYTAHTFNSVVAKTFGLGFVLNGFELIRKNISGSSYEFTFGPGTFVSNGVITEITSSNTISMVSEPSIPIAIVAFTENEKDPDLSLSNSDPGVYLQMISVSDVYPGHAVIGTIIPSKSDFQSNTDEYAANSLEARYMPAPHYSIEELVADLKGGVTGFDTLSMSRGQFSEISSEDGFTSGYRAELRFAPANIEMENMIVFANGEYQSPTTDYIYESGGTFIQKKNQSFPLYIGSHAEDSVSYVVSPDIVFQETYGFNTSGEYDIPSKWRTEVVSGKVSIILFANGLLLDPDYFEYNATRTKMIVKAPHPQSEGFSEPMPNTSKMIDEEEVNITSITLVGVRGLLGITKVAQGYASIPVETANGQVLANQNYSTSHSATPGIHGDKGSGLGPWANVPKVGLPLAASGSVQGQATKYPIKSVVHNLAINTDNYNIFRFENDNISQDEWPQGSIHTRIPFFTNTGSLQVFVDGRLAHANHAMMDEIVAWDFKDYSWPRGFYVRERNANFFDLSIRPLKGTFVNYIDFRDEVDPFPQEEWDAVLEDKIWDVDGEIDGGHTLANKIVVLHFDNSAARNNIFIENQIVPNSICASVEFTGTEACKAFLDSDRIRTNGTPSTVNVASSVEFPDDTGGYNIFLTRSSLTGETPSSMTKTPNSSASSWRINIGNTMWAKYDVDYLDAAATVYSFAQSVKNAGRLHYDQSPSTGSAGLLYDQNTQDKIAPKNADQQQIGFLSGTGSVFETGSNTTHSAVIGSMQKNTDGGSSSSASNANFFGPENPIITLGGLDNYLLPLFKEIGFTNRHCSAKFGLDENGRLDFNEAIELFGKHVNSDSVKDSDSLIDVINTLFNIKVSGSAKRLAILYGTVHPERTDKSPLVGHPAYEAHNRDGDGHMWISLETGDVRIPSQWGGFGWICGHVNFDKPDTVGVSAEYNDATVGLGINKIDVKVGGATTGCWAAEPYSTGPKVQQGTGMSVAYTNTPLMAFVSPAVTTYWPDAWEKYARPQAFPAPMWEFEYQTFSSGTNELALHIRCIHVPGTLNPMDWCLSYPVHFTVIGATSNPQYILNETYPYVFRFKKAQGGSDVLSPSGGNVF